MTIDSTNELKLAFLAGKLKAISYGAGDEFLGSIPESERHGYRSNPILHAAFSCGYHEHLPKNIRVERDSNKIVSIG
jgi:hypothetical protein